MNQETKIVPAIQSHSDDILKIFYEGFSEKMGFVTKNADQKLSIAHDFNFFNFEPADREFVGMIDGRILGFLSLRYLGQSKIRPAQKLNTYNLLRKYGPLVIIKVWLFAVVFRHKLKEGELYIDTLGVLEDARGKGVGTALMNFCESYAKKQNCKTLTLMVIYENPKAKALYERLGYRVISSQSLRLLKKSTGVSGAYLMEKKIL